jgi:cation transport ATPase
VLETKRRVMKFVETVHIARNCRRIIFQNFYGTLIVDTIGIGLAGSWPSQSATGGVYSRCVRADVHPELHTAVAAQRAKQSSQPETGDGTSLKMTYPTSPSRLVRVSIRGGK